MDSIRMKASLAYYNIKALPVGILVMAVGYVIGLSLIIHVFHGLNTTPLLLGEYMLSLLGIIMITHLAVFEKDSGIHEMTYTKKVSHLTIVSLRVAMYILMLYLLLWIAFLLESLYVHVDNMVMYVHGSFITALYLGIIGMVAAYITKQRAIGYMIPFGYYLIDLFTKGKYTRSLYLFSLTEGSWQGKVYIGLGGLVVMILFLVYLRRE